MNCPKCDHVYFQEQGYCSYCGWVPKYVVTYDNGSGYREWASPPQETVEEAIAAAENHNPKDQAAIVMVDGQNVLKSVKNL